ncbi:DMT family transporter [Magnetovibrio sp. PR-2]|uniref:DMT family transporter n=1 Tax=Magnetovibrio sp. PR-2 TaxID=3120356 RepID=UPI002FCE2254
MSSETSSSSRARVEGLWLAAMPGVFVLLWSTGFVGAKLGLPYAEPFTFLFLRYFALVVILVLVAFAFRAPWPKGIATWWHVGVVGVTVHGGYLGGVFYSIYAGLPTSVTAIIVGLQPLLSAVGAHMFLSERIRARQWLGLVLGLLGVALVLGDKITLNIDGYLGPVFAVSALFCMTFGTIYQKRHNEQMDLRSGSAIQFGAAAIPTGIGAVLFETREVVWSGEFIFTLSWLTIVISIGAITLLFILIRQGAVAKVASLFYLVPPVTAVYGWLMFGETLSALSLVGMAVVVMAVALATHSVPEQEGETHG